ncbi:hypothetical protein ACWC4E_33310 [Streptomyces sp. NPDC001273]|uniref:hypothetical protein n=1 Tax=unclassified Streptomyces TaxID=2593676 RepID=UPI0034099CB6
MNASERPCAPNSKEPDDEDDGTGRGAGRGLGAGARYGLGLLRIDLTCGGSYYSHPGDMAGYMTRSGFSEDGRRVVVVEATGDGSAPELDTMRAVNDLIDRQLCAVEGR